ncbi:MAG: SDR family oxidoreductase [Bacilli bacterium]|nr:SDR family oxidoreductase [Bacilli bacterium]
MSKVLITGSSSGIGLAAAKKYLAMGHEVYGLDLKPSAIKDEMYHHFIADVSDKASLPEIEGVEILFSNAGVQGKDEIKVNLIGSMNVVEKYAFNDKIKAVLINASASAHTGFEFAEYSASKSGLLGYAKNVAWRLAKEYKAICNSISFGGVLTHLNDEVISDPESWKRIMDVTPLQKWVTLEEAAEWIYFLTAINKSASGQDILIDNGEKDLNCTFVWPSFDK